MTINEAIRDAGENWIRPLWWRGSGEALAVQDDRFLFVPTATGGDVWCPRVKDITDCWEIVTPDEVLGERP